MRQAVAGVLAHCWRVCPHARAQSLDEPRAALRRELPLDEGSRFWFPLHRTSWKQAAGEGVYWSLTGVGYSAELIQVLSRDILSVHWALAATHWDGAGLERGCDVSIIKQHLRFFETRENHAMYGALLSAATGGCWPKAHVARLLHVEQDESCVRCGAVLDDSSHQKWSCPVINAIPHDDVRKSQHLFQRAKCEKNSSPCFWTRGLVPAEWMEVPVGCGRTTRESTIPVMC